jgi:hypothetical protein
MNTFENNNQDKEKEEFPGYPHQPAGEDIYNQEEELNMNLGDDEAQLDEDAMDKGLDIPGADLDDSDEEIGEEDEENNYYSLGGDNHENLEEDNGDDLV